MPRILVLPILALLAAGTVLRAEDAPQFSTEEGKTLFQLVNKAQQALDEKKIQNYVDLNRVVATRKLPPEVLADIAQLRMTAAYNMACGLAMLEKKDEVLKALSAAVDLGFDEADHMKQDTDLQAFHGSGEFDKIVARAAELRDKKDRKWTGQLCETAHGTGLLIMGADNTTPVIVLKLSTPAGPVADNLAKLKAQKATVEVTGSGGGLSAHTVISVTDVKAK